MTDIYISATSIEVRGGSGETLATFDYFQPADEVVAGLTAALGSAPITEDYESEHVEQHPGTRYLWGNTFLKDPGLGLTPYTTGDFVFVDQDPVGVEPYLPNTLVQVSAEAVNGIHISTVDGISVGDNAAELAEEYPDTAYSSPQDGALDLSVGLVSLPPGDVSADPVFSVHLRAPDPLGPITVFVAPVPNWGV